MFSIFKRLLKRNVLEEKIEEIDDSLTNTNNNLQELREHLTDTNKEIVFLKERLREQSMVFNKEIVLLKEQLNNNNKRKILFDHVFINNFILRTETNGDYYYLFNFNKEIIFNKIVYKNNLMEFIQECYPLVIFNNETMNSFYKSFFDNEKFDKEVIEYIFNYLLSRNDIDFKKKFLDTIEYILEAKSENIQKTPEVFGNSILFSYSENAIVKIVIETFNLHDDYLLYKNVNRIKFKWLEEKFNQLN